MTSTAPSRLLTAFLYVTSFLCGFVVLTLEILGFRLFAPFFGYTIYVSGTLVTVVLAALALGSWLGGVLADRKPDLKRLYLMVFAAGLYLAMMSLVHQRLLLALSSGPAVWGTVAAGVIVFGPPMLLLSTASPFIIKVLASRPGGPGVGSIAGAVSAIATFGSIAGSAITTFVFIPAIGSRMTLLLCTLICITLPLFHLPWHNRRFWWMAAVIPVILLIRPSLIVESNAILVKESPYNLIKLIHDNGQFKLRLNDSRNIQSRFPSDLRSSSVCTGAYTDYLSVAPMLARGKRVLILGLGGGESANQMRIMHGADVHAVEIDPDVVKIAQRYFGIRRFNPDIRVFIDDARRFARNGRKGRYDVVEIDLYHGGLYVPFYCATREFFSEVAALLDTNGVMVMNVLCDSAGRYSAGLYQSVAATVCSVFPSVFDLRTPSLPYNAVIYAFCAPVTAGQVRDRLAPGPAMALHADAARMADSVAAHIAAFSPLPGTKLLTDDHAPIEPLTSRLIARIMSAGLHRPRT